MILANLRRHKRLLESQANITQFEESQRARAAAEAEFRTLREYEMKRRQAEVRAWLSAADAEVDQENAAFVRAEYPSTGLWLLKHNQIEAWCDPNTSAMPLLWMNGIPGAGMRSSLLRTLRTTS